MLVEGKPYRTVWRDHSREGVVQIIDQRKLPWEFEVEDLGTVAEVAEAKMTDFATPWKLPGQ